MSDDGVANARLRVYLRLVWDTIPRAPTAVCAHTLPRHGTMDWLVPSRATPRHDELVKGFQAALLHECGLGKVEVDSILQRIADRPIEMQEEYTRCRYTGARYVHNHSPQHYSDIIYPQRKHWWAYMKAALDAHSVRATGGALSRKLSGGDDSAQHTHFAGVPLEHVTFCLLHKIYADNDEYMFQLGPHIVEQLRALPATFLEYAAPRPQPMRLPGWDSEFD